MPYTGQEVFNESIAIIDELSDSGTVNDNQVKEYKNRAPALLNLWHREWAKLEHVSDVNKITSLSQELQVSDEGCAAGAFYLARHFALSDQNTELANICKEEYEKLRREGKKPLQEEEITDVYNTTDTFDETDIPM